MRPIALGPVEFDVVTLDSDWPSPRLLGALASQIDTGAVRVADFVVVSKSQRGEVSVTEVDAAEFSLAGVELLVQGLAGDDDLELLAEMIPPGTSAAIIGFELAWAAELADQLASCGGHVVATKRIPAPIINAVIGVAMGD